MVVTTSCEISLFHNFAEEVWAVLRHNPRCDFSESDVDRVLGHFEFFVRSGIVIRIEKEIRTMAADHAPEGVIKIAFV